MSGNMLKTGDYVVMLRGVDDVSDGQICKVLAPDESAAVHRYRPQDRVPVHYWTGYIAWTSQDNLVPITVNATEIEPLFQLGFSRTGSEHLQF